MTTTEDELRAENERLKAQNAALQKQVLVQAGGGTAVQGDHNQVVGKDGVLINGSVAGNVIIAPPPPGADPADLRRAYLARLFESASALSLAGVDPKAAGDAHAHLSLSAVYTALLTLATDSQERFEGGRNPQAGEPRRLSALEQLDQHPRLVLLGDPGSGKSTFVNFVALCLAGQGLEHAEINLDLLITPLPAEKEQKEQAPPQPWRHGALLPVRVILRDFAARGLPPPGQPATAKHLWDFITADLQAAALPAFGRHLASELLKSGGLLLLDGLDEVPEASARRVQIKQAVEDFAAVFQRCRILITSRTYAYQKQDWRLPRFQEALLAPFTRAQIGHFITRWYAQIALLRGMDAADAQGRAALLQGAVFNSDRLLGLAERPLLLTLMASLHAWRSGSLPEKREELYADTVALLLDWWERPKVVRDAEGRPLVQQQSLSEWIKADPQKVRGLLNELAYRAHAAQPELRGAADISEDALVGGLMRLSNNPEVNPARLVDYLSQRAGLLIPRGVGVYTFPHRTFQEYLAACYLTDHDYPDLAADLACADPNRWREALLLAGAKAGRGAPAALWLLVEALCFAELNPDSAEASLWGARLAGQLLSEAADLATNLGQRQAERSRLKLERVQRGLLAVLRSGRLPAVERAGAGLSLARLGDPRPEAMTVAGMQFCFVPAGKFLMGSKAGVGDTDEQPQHEVDLPDYWIGRYPVTVAQWREFVTTRQYSFDNRWQYNPCSNDPVVAVAWYEAVQFCQWLTDQYRPFLPSGSAFTLPSEAEWEKSARGGLNLPPQPVIRCLNDGLADSPKKIGMVVNAAPRRDYPWIGEFDPNCANLEASGIGTTSAVGCFPGGSSPYGCEEMAGNAWEWTRSLWGKDFFNPDFTYPYAPADGREDLNAGRDVLRVLRGGSFGASPSDARCAFRYRDDPAYRGRSFGFRVVLLLCR